MPLETRRVVYLSPDDDCHAALLAATRAAQRSLHLLIYGFTLLDLGQVLIDKHAAGLTVGVVADRTQAAGRAERALLQYLVDNGVPLTVTTSTQRGAIMHQKVALVDVEALGPDHNDSFAVYGSYNFSASAQAESNFLISENAAPLCSYFWRQYEGLEAFGKDHVPQLTPSPSASAGTGHDGQAHQADP